MNHDIRVLAGGDEHRRAVDVFMTSLVGNAWPPADVDPVTLFEPGRCLGAFVDGEMVGTAASFSSTLLVPGGARVPHAAVTDVGVLPTHTRRGVAGALLRRQFEQIAGRGELVATLRASEATIYERFGYGVASEAAGIDVRVARARFRAGVPEGGPIRFTDPRDSWDLLPRIYDLPGARPGAIGRHAFWWQGQRAHIGRGPGPIYLIVHGEPGAEDGYARYQPIENGRWLTSPDRALTVTDLVIRSPRARYGLLRFLFSIDLVDRVVLPLLPADHSIGKLLTDERAARTTGVSDETWLRLIDVPGALAARTYRSTATVVIDVTDELLPANTGRYEISAAGVGPSSGEPDLMVDVASLACVYLGGTKWWQLAEAGRVTERVPAALQRADDLFGTPRNPFAGTMF